MLLNSLVLIVVFFFFFSPLYSLRVRHEKGFPSGSDGKVSDCNVEDPGLIPGLGRSPGEGNGNPSCYSCLENSMDGGAL